MENVVIITIGTRDIQLKKSELGEVGFRYDSEKGKVQYEKLPETNVDIEVNRNFPDFLCLKYPRQGGEKILENFEIFEPVLVFPLVEDVLKRISIQNGIDKVILVYTDQWDGIFPIDNNQNRDTLFFRQIFRLALQKMYPAFEITHKDEDIKINQKLTDIDFQYRLFNDRCQLLFEDPDMIGQIHLLPQGGIDQVNFALSLKLIQTFGHKVQYWQKEEGGNARRLKFPTLFLHDLNKQKIIKNLNDFEFGLINESLTSDLVILNLAHYADARLQMNYAASIKDLEKIKKEISSDLYQELEQVKNKRDDLLKLQDLYISSKIKLKNKKYGDFIWRLFSISENLFAVLSEGKIKLPKDLYNPTSQRDGENPEWIKALKKISDDLPDQLKKCKILMSNPTRKAYFHVLQYLMEKNEVQTRYEEAKLIQVNSCLSKLNERRNKLAHNLEAVTLRDIDEALGDRKQLVRLMTNLDEILQVTDYAVFDKIKQELLNRITGSIDKD